MFVYKKTTNNIYHYGEDGNLSGKLIYMIDSNNITYDLTYDQHGNLKSFKSGLNPYYITVNKYNDNRELVCSFVQFIRKDENGNYIYNECDSP